MKERTKFKIGDRVRVISSDSSEHTDVGQVGTILESSYLPWIEFDSPTRYKKLIQAKMCIGRKSNDPDSIVGKAGYCDCVNQDYLELVSDTQVITSPTIYTREKEELVRLILRQVKIVDRAKKKAKDAKKVLERLREELFDRMN